ncbi:MAG: hypothetical protein RR929_01070 [Erysipelotrichaceae bacterium]
MLSKQEAIRLMCKGIDVKIGALTIQDIDLFQLTWTNLYEVEKLAFSKFATSRVKQETFIIEYITNIYNVQNSSMSEVKALLKLCLALIDLKPQEYYDQFKQVKNY